MAFTSKEQGSGNEAGGSTTADHSKWQKEYSHNRPSASSNSTSSTSTTSNSPSKRSSMTSWLNRSSTKSPPAGSSSSSTAASGDTSSTSTRPPAPSSSSSSFFDHRPGSSSIAKTSSDDRYSESPMDMSQHKQLIHTKSGTSNASTNGRPPAKTASSSSSSSTSSNKTITTLASIADQAGPSSSTAATTSTTNTAGQANNTGSTSPKEAPPSQSSTRSSCPLPSLRMPFMGGSAAGAAATGKSLPSGACASMPSMKAGMLGARAGISRAFAGALGGAGGGASMSRKGGPEVIQNPRFKAVPVGEELKELLASSTSATPRSKADNMLVIDLRPHTAFVTQGRIKTSINICVPSTLLRRPAFGLNKIAETISSRRDQAHFERVLGVSQSPEVDEKEKKKVLIMDQETVLLSQESTVHSLMSKIEKSGYSGEIYWVRGGWNAVNTNVESDMNVLGDFVNMDILNEEEEEDEEVVEEGAMEVDGHSVDGQDTKTPRQPFPGAESTGTSSIPVDGNGNSGAGGAYFQNYLQGPRGINTKGRSSQSSFTSTASSDSLFPSSVASSQSSMGSAGDSNHLSSSSSAASKDRASSTSPVVPQFDSGKLHLPHLRPSTSPAPTSTASSAGPAHQASRSRATMPPSSSAAGAGLSLSNSATKSRSTSAGGAAIIRPKNLPMAAFQYNSTAQGAQSGDPQSQKSGNSGKGHFQMGLDNASYGSGGSGASSGMEKTKSGSNPFAKKTAANPFFDNIRQNIEVRSSPTSFTIRMCSLTYLAFQTVPIFGSCTGACRPAGNPTRIHSA